MGGREDPSSREVTLFLSTTLFEVTLFGSPPFLGIEVITPFEVLGTSFGAPHLHHVITTSSGVASDTVCMGYPLLESINPYSAYILLRCRCTADAACVIPYYEVEQGSMCTHPFGQKPVQ